MKTVEEITRILSRHLPKIQTKYPVERIGVFGSRTRGEHMVESDVDILVALDQPIGLEIVDLHSDLEQILGLAVDLVTLGAVERNPLLWESIQKDLIYVET